ncbi:ATP-binding cassette transporter abc4 [Psilocybe cubensis]|uniref:ATP-binding cassette transporter abc4 n=1 Tax=Psilocybe cubensis TaxID=181762 RepID=A0ACB8GYI0_PSICU|nr:ATP-binding cassette transporter abc4 [Psilocybe cubensis]KAH9480681.1 ATP-binding cassette transporter abc4 [Psilocybe cubensis]
MPIPNDEQTCSIFSRAVYTYLDPVIALGYRVSHLEFDQLPPLPDTEEAKNIVKYAFPHLDLFHGAQKRHIFFGLMRVLRLEYTIISVCIILMGVCEFILPLAINRLLKYLETGGENARIKPWFWILCIFCGPFFRTLLFQNYIFVATTTFVRVEGLLTQLVFEHSLRIRVKNDPSTSTEEPQASEDLAVEEASSEDEPTTTAPSLQDKKIEKSGANVLGKINNLVTTDLANIVEAREFIVLLVYVPLQIILSVVFLYQLLGWSAFAGIAVTIVLFPVPGYIAKLIQDTQKVLMEKTDARVQDVAEAINVIRMIKVFGWEEKMSKRIKQSRDNELTSLWRLKLLDAANSVITYVIPIITMLVTFGVYAIIMKGELNASKIFSSITVFNILRTQLRKISFEITAAAQGKVSLDRINDFLKNTELLDAFSSQAPSMILKHHLKDEIGFNDVTFTWSLLSNEGSLTPTTRSFKLRIPYKLLFQKNSINLIVVPTGSGKTSMLMALLGEMYFLPSSPDSCFNLPRGGGIAFAAQDSWVQNATIRENILFGSAYDEVRYKKVIQQCALDKDLQMFEAGDATEVGEKGLTLSGGQKARVTLARAIYSPAKILLLDDVLAALDVHTSSWIVNQCLQGDLVKDRTILLLTHNIALTAPIAHFIVSLNSDGTLHTQSKDIKKIVTNDSFISREAEIDNESIAISHQEVHSLSHKNNFVVDGKLIMKEEIIEGHVTWKSIKVFLKGLGGNHPVWFYVLWISGIALTDWLSTFQVWFLGYWGSQYEFHTPSEVPASLQLAATTIYNSAYIHFVYGTMRASRFINGTLVDSFLSSTLRWLDETPTGRIIARCTQDISAVDGIIPFTFRDVNEVAISMTTKIVVIVLFAPFFLFPGFGVAILGFYLGNMYLKAQMSVKREKSNARSPLLAHFNAAISGLVSIRAYGAEGLFKDESINRINHYVRVGRASVSLNKWIGVRIDLLGELFTASLAAYLLYGHSIGAANTGVALSLAAELCALILIFVRAFNEFEVQANSLERIQGFLDIEHEPQQTEDGKPPASWPTSGDLRVECLSARYSQVGPKVLHDLSFHIESGQRIGIGEQQIALSSSLTLALLRCIFTEGTVYYDGVPTNQINLDVLRSNITIIPQSPELLSGTLRRNLDPFEQHGDATLNDALRAAGLFSFEELGEACLTLDSNIASAGCNLSVGQKQILALARAMVRGSKLLVLDEGRLQTIMDADKMVEFDSPLSLLGKESGMFRALVDGSGDRATLYAMAKRKTLNSSHRH